MPPKAQTLKQAKAAYKTRNQSTLTEREKKQIERSVELDRRAWRAKEQEKRKAEAKAKREEREKRERDREAAIGVGVGMGERRCDRFGFVGSQMHLGVFFGGASRAGGGRSAATEQAGAGGVVEEDCFDGDLDDETLLDALHETKDRESKVAHRSAALELQGAIDGTPPVTKDRREAARGNGSDLDFSWDDLDSSTQIARDIANEPSKTTEAKMVQNSRSPATSFGFEEFDLSVEDIEAAQTKKIPEQKMQHDQKLMPPPVPRKKTPVLTKPATKPLTNKQALPLPPLSVKARAATHVQVQLKRLTPPKTISKPCSSAQLGFTLAELESFVDDNLQLTQVAPG